METNERPYAKAAEQLQKLILGYEYAKNQRLRTLADIAAVLGVKSPSTIMGWLNGVRRPQRRQAIRAAEGLELDDKLAIAELYGYDRDEDGATSIPELIDYAESFSEWNEATRRNVITLLRQAEAMTNRYDAEVVGDLLRKPWPLAIRAQRIADYANMARSFPLALHVA